MCIRDRSFIDEQIKILMKDFIEGDMEEENNTLSTVTPIDTKMITTGKQKVSVEKRKSRDRDREEIEESFSVFWKIYPRKDKKLTAQKAWHKHKPNIKDVLTALKWQMGDDNWLIERGKFIPHASTYINQKRWQDEPKAEVIDF